MPLSSDLALVGVSYRTAPVEIRERCAVASRDVVPWLRQLMAAGVCEEAFLLSTCNRTELLVSGHQAESAASNLRERLFGSVGSEIYVHHGAEALFHLFRVAAGLDSQVLGESQILSQVKEAIEHARVAEALGPDLNPLLRQALEVGKKIRTETRVGEGTLSVARAAVELAKKVLGRLDTASALIVGTGETGILAARHLRAEGARRLIFANRTRARAEEAAAEFDGEVFSLEELGDVLSDVDLTLVSVDAPEPVVRSEHVVASRLRRHDRPPMIIDLSVPRGVSPEVVAHPELLCHDLDDLDEVVARHRDERTAEIASAERILLAEVHKCLALRAYASLKPVVSGMKDRFQAARDELLASADGLSSTEMVDRLCRRLLAEALDQIKLGTREAFSEERLGEEYRKYLERLLG